MKKIALLLLFIINHYGCSVPSDRFLINTIIKAYELCKDKNDCTIELSSELNFDWDTMYIFGINATPQYVSKVIGIKYDKSKDLTRLIIFTKGKNIVSEIRDSYQPAKPFKIQFQEDVKKVENRDSRFKIESPSQGIYYLIPLTK